MTSRRTSAACRSLKYAVEHGTATYSDDARKGVDYMVVLISGVSGVDSRITATVNRTSAIVNRSGLRGKQCSFQSVARGVTMMSA